MLSFSVKIDVKSVCTHQKFTAVYLTFCIGEKLDIIPPVCMGQATEHLDCWVLPIYLWKHPSNCNSLCRRLFWNRRWRKKYNFSLLNEPCEKKDSDSSFQWVKKDAELKRREILRVYWHIFIFTAMYHNQQDWVWTLWRRWFNNRGIHKWPANRPSA